MPGKRIYDPSLIRTTFKQAMIDSAEAAELLSDWPALDEAKPVAMKLLGNCRSQGSDTNVPQDYTDDILSTHAYIRLSADGGDNWIVFKMSACDGSETPVAHNPVTIGGQANGLAIDVNQIITLALATQTTAGAMSAADKVILDNSASYAGANVGAGAAIFKDITGTTFNFRTLTNGSKITLTQSTDEVLIELNSDEVPDVLMSAIIGADYVFVDEAALIADQINQVAGQIYQVEPNIFYKFIGTLGSGIGDYTALVNPNFKQSIYTVRLPSQSTVQARINAAVEGVDYPTGWVLTTGVSPVDINIEHNLGRRVANITIFSETTASEHQQLFDTAAHNGVTTPDVNNVLVQSLATITTAINIYINFV